MSARRNSFLLLCAAVAALVLSGKGNNAANADSAWDRSKAVKATQIDLDGDGRLETIKLTLFRKVVGNAYGYSNKYRLTVNGQHIFDHMDTGNIYGFYIADINRADRYKEIVVHGLVYPDFNGGRIYAFIGRKLHRVSTHVGVWETFQGDGTVRALSHQGFWAASLIYKLNNKHKLVFVPQPFYEVGIKSKVHKPLPLHPHPHSKKISAVLPVGRKVAIVKSDLKGWYLIRSAGGSQGWVQEQGVLAHLRGGIVVAG